MPEYARLLRGYRLARRFTQVVLAARIGVTQPTWAQYEAGRRRPSLDKLLQIQTVFDLDDDAYMVLCKAVGAAA